MNRIGAALAAVAMGTMLSAAEAAPAPLVVFGDSLSDIGNVGRFTDGPLWVERLAAALGTPLAPSSRGGSDYARGGARTHGHAGSLRDQVDQYLRETGGKADPDALYVVLGGGNDIIAAPLAPEPRRVVHDATATLAGVVADLAAAGARNFVVPTLPDVGDAPYARLLGPVVSGVATGMSIVFNETLAAHLDELERLDGVRIVRPDFAAAHARALAEPRKAGLAETAQPCSDILRGTRCADPASHLYWDGLHPTSTGHRRMAAVALAALGAVFR